MADYDQSRQRLTVKLVYYGPALSGKTTNLLRLHDGLNPQLRGELMSLETRNDRTLFFDLLPLGFRAPSGLIVRLKLYTVPGQVQHDSTRKAVLSRADGVVFVADSQVTQRINNAESFDNLAANAARVGLDFETLPLVVQFNKRDLRDIVPESEVTRSWSQTPWPVLLACATHGDGVGGTFSALLHRVYGALDGEFALAARHGAERELFVAAVLGIGHASSLGSGECEARPLRVR
ncbi:MAG: GTPase domain-containing protein, partial [Gammaproteobacteria bacterium]